MSPRVCSTQVPAFTYGGPVVPPDQPSNESAKLWESNVLIEFIADLCPAAGLLPSDPAVRAHARLLVVRAHDTLHHAFRSFFFRIEYDLDNGGQPAFDCLKIQAKRPICSIFDRNRLRTSVAESQMLVWNAFRGGTNRSGDGLLRDRCGVASLKNSLQANRTLVRL